MADKKMLIVRQKQKSRKPSKTRLSALYPVFLSGFEPLAFRLGVKRTVSTQVQPNPCGISKSNKINTFKPFISTWEHLRPPQSGMIFVVVLAKY